MKAKIGAGSALLLMGLISTTTAFGQATPSAVGGVSTSEESGSSILNNIGASYTGIYAGPAMDTDLPGKTAGGDDQFINHRPSLKYKFSPNFDMGAQARVNTFFTEKGVEARNDNYRIFSNIKNVVKTEETNLTLTPRIALPTSNGSHNSHLLFAPELIATYIVEPGKGRMSLEFGSTFQAPIYHGLGAKADDRMNFYMAPWFAANYQMTPKLVASMGIYPEFKQFKSKSDMDALSGASNELDVGVNWDITSKVSLNPYIATDLNENQLENSSLNVVLSASFL